MPLQCPGASGASQRPQPGWLGRGSALSPSGRPCHSRPRPCGAVQCSCPAWGGGLCGSPGLPHAETAGAGAGCAGRHAYSSAGGAMGKGWKRREGKGGEGKRWARKGCAVSLRTKAASCHLSWPGSTLSLSAYEKLQILLGLGHSFYWMGSAFYIYVGLRAFSTNPLFDISRLRVVIETRL